MDEDLRIEDGLIIPPPIEQIEEWVNLPTTKNFRGIGGVKAANETIMISPEQARFYAEEIKRCKDDIIHFAENWFYIISYRGKEKIKLYEKQKEMVKSFINNPFTICLAARQSGKCVSYNTEIIIRHRKTGKIKSISIGEFYKKHFNTPKIQIALEVKHKFVEQRCVSKYEVLTDTGWVDIKGVAKTIPFKVQTIYTENYELDCADEHIVFDNNWNEIFAKDLKLDDIIQTENGPEHIVAIDRRDCNPIESMYDLMLGEETNHRYITNGIISHNSTIYTIFALYYCMFNKDKKVLMVANKENTVKELLQRIKMAVTMLPDFLKLGITTWTAKKIEFENGSSISVSATSPDAARGSSCDICVDDDSWIIIKENDEIKHVPIRYLIGKINTIDNRDNRYFTFKDLLNSELNKNYSDIEYILDNKKINNYHSIFNCYSIPRCPVCGKKLINRFRHGKYYITCSTKCSREFNKHFIDDLNPEYKGIKILTNNGFEKFDGISVSNSKYQYKINFESGAEITCSPNHKFIVDGKLKTAEQLNVNDNVFTIKHLTKITSINKIESKTHLYDIINSGKDNLFYTNGVITHNCILDEAAFIPNNLMDEFTASVFPTISSKPEGKIIAVSTPNGIGNWFERTYHKALYAINNNKSDDLQWQQITFPWTDHPERDENWKKKQIAMLGGDSKKFDQEFNCCVLDCYITVKDTKTGEIKKIKIEEFEEILKLHNINLDNSRYQILTPNGFENFEAMIINNKHCYEIVLENGMSLKCSDDHPLQTIEGIFIKLSNCEIGTPINTINGLSNIVSIKDIGYNKCYDLKNVKDTHTYYTNGIVSHNCFLGSSATLFDPTVLEHCRKFVENNTLEYREEVLYNHKIKIWNEPQPNHAYVLGVDIADGSGGDNSVIQIFDVTNFKNIEQAVSFASREIDTNTLALIVARLGARYNNALVSGERNGVGAGFFDALTNTFDYDNTVNFKNKEEMADRPGIYSTNNNKIDACLWAKSIMSMTVNLPEYAKVIIKENNTCYEMEYFESKTLNRTVTYNASKNNHDDFVMSFVWAMFAIRLDMADNYFTIKSSTFTRNGLEIPQIILPLETSTYTEEYLLKKLEGEIQNSEQYNDTVADSSKREMLQDSIFNAVMNKNSMDEDDSW